jgi:hypothetical protein
LIVFDDKQAGQIPQRRHVETFIDLALIDRTIPKIGHADIRLFPIFMGKGQAASDRHLRADNAVTAEKILFAAEHMHGTALAA